MTFGARGGGGVVLPGDNRLFELFPGRVAGGGAGEGGFKEAGGCGIEGRAVG